MSAVGCPSVLLSFLLLGCEKKALLLVKVMTGIPWGGAYTLPHTLGMHPT